MAANFVTGQICDGTIAKYHQEGVFYQCAKFHAFIIKSTIRSKYVTYLLHYKAMGLIVPLYKAYKILTGHENIYPNIFSRIMAGKTTTGHAFTQVKEQRRLDFRKCYLSQTNVKEWNNCRLHSSSVTTV